MKVKPRTVEEENPLRRPQLIGTKACRRRGRRRKVEVVVWNKLDLLRPLCACPSPLIQSIAEALQCFHFFVRLVAAIKLHVHSMGTKALNGVLYHSNDPIRGFMSI